MLLFLVISTSACTHIHVSKSYHREIPSFGRVLTIIFFLASGVAFLTRKIGENAAAGQDLLPVIRIHVNISLYFSE